MQFQNDLCEIEVIDELSLSERSRQYAKEYLLGENFSNVPFYGIIVKSFDSSKNSCVISATGGNTKVHPRSAVIINENLFVAIGNLICCLEIPSLTLHWHQQVDMATCFGIYISPDKTGIISHGEIDIVKISFNGQIEWRASGKDIFSEGFVLLSDHVEATDFNHEKYYINISNGQVSLKHGGYR